MHKQKPYIKEYSKEFVDKWDELINWDGRSKSEGSFFIDLLNEIKAKKIIDVATGTGYHSILLQQNGFDVTSLDGCKNMLNKAEENAKKRNINLNTIHSDWENITPELKNKYDALICLGNSFTHILEEEVQEKVIQKFHSLIKDNGFMIIDVRNYNYVSSDDYQPTNKYYYTGEKFKINPVDQSSKLIKLQYSYQDNSVFHLTLNPLDLNLFMQLIEKNGFKIKSVYADFKLVEKVSNEEFVCLLVQK